MKKYRLTKITVKTREIVSMSKNMESETQSSVCPICHSPLALSLSAAENSNAETNRETRLAAFPPAEVPDAIDK